MLYIYIYMYIYLYVYICIYIYKVHYYQQPQDICILIDLDDNSIEFRLLKSTRSGFIGKAFVNDYAHTNGNP